MLVSDIIGRVRRTVGDITVYQATDTAILSWIVDGIRECAIANTLLQKTATSNLVVGTNEYSLPTDILKLHSVWVDSVKIRMLTLQEWEELNAGDLAVTNDTSSGQPYQAYIWTNKLFLWPKPDTVYQLKVNYIYDPVENEASITTATELSSIIPISYQPRIVSYCLAQVALQDDDIAKYQLHMQEFTTGVQNLMEQSKQEEDLYPFPSISSRDMGGYEYGEYQW